MDSAIHFGQWCKTTYGCRHFGDCQEHIPDYVDWLAQQGKSASTIHTYLAGVCRVFEVPLADVKVLPAKKPLSRPLTPTMGITV